MHTDFISKLLYRQKSISEEDHEVTSAVYALSWRYPGSTASVTTRARMTIVGNFNDAAVHNIVAANIEVWKDTGWVSFEDCFDEKFSMMCNSSEEVEAKCIEMLALFFVGKTDDEETTRPFDPGSTPAPRRKKPTVKVPSPDGSDNKDENAKNQNVDKETGTVNEKADKKDLDAPDFEWI